MMIEIGGDELTADELAYLESGGKVTSGLPASETPAEAPANEPAPAPTSEPQQPAQQADGDGDDGEDEVDEIVVGPDGKLRAKNGKFVSHRALHKEREKRKAIAAERDELRVRLARGEERLAILNEAFNATGDPASQARRADSPQQPVDPLNEEPIDPEKDFYGWAKQVQRQNDALRRQITESTGAIQSRETFRNVTEAYHSDARRFMSQEPNFEHAYKHLVAGRHRELELMGMRDEKQRNAFIAQEESQLVMQALQTGQSPAEVVYRIAQARGFTPQAAAPAARGGAQSPQPAPQRRTAAQQKIEQLRNGQNASQSLSNGAGGANEGLTLNSLANMSDEEFARAVDSMSKAQLERIMGR